MKTPQREKIWRENNGNFLFSKTENVEFENTRRWFIFYKVARNTSFSQDFWVENSERIILNHAKRLSHDENNNNSILEFHLGYLASTYNVTIGG